MKKLFAEENDQYILSETTEYKNEMAREKLRKIKLVNDTNELDLRKKQDCVCYISIALSAFENAVGDIFSRIKNSPEQLTALLQLDPQQAELLNDFIDSILVDLSNLDIELESTTATDAKLYSDQKAKKEKLKKAVE